MKAIWKDILLAAFMGLAVPGMLLNFGAAMMEGRGAEAASVPQPTEPREDTVLMRLRTGDGYVEQPLEEYLVGVLAAEVPADFEPEALKAQAVVARTYARKAYVYGGKHGDGSVCPDPGCCQGCVTPEDYLASGGTEESLLKFRDAVQSTRGQVLTYEGALIEATYFSCSGGRTEDAVAVWGTDFPYLQSVDSPGEESAAHYSDTVVFTPEEFASALGIAPEGSPEAWFGKPVYTEGGGVLSMEIGGVEFDGTRLRTLLGLRSTAFSLSVRENGIHITTRGYGHRVGMSQFGADAMAASGSDYKSILYHYYRGAVLQDILS